MTDPHTETECTPQNWEKAGELIGTVVHINHNSVQVKIEPQHSCSSCSMSGACAVFGQPQPITITAENSFEVTIGQQVMVAIAPQSRLWSSWWVYLFPTLCMLSAAIITERFHLFPVLGQGGPVLAAFIAFLIGCSISLGIDRITKKTFRKLKPKIANLV